MLRERRVGVLLMVVLGLLVLSLPAGPAKAADAEEKARIEKARVLLKELKAVHKEHEKPKVTELLDRTTTLHNKLETDSWRSKLVEQMCKLLRDKDLTEGREQALTAMLSLDDAKVAYKHVREIMPGPRVGVTSTLQANAIRAAGTLGQDSAIPQLVELMKKGKDIHTTKSAIQALGGFAKSQKRIFVLGEMLDFLRLNKPSRAPGKRISYVTRQRWSTLSGPLVSSLNSISGRKERSAAIWLELYAENKKTLNRLLVTSSD